MTVPAIDIADQQCAGFEVAPWRAAVPRQTVQERQALVFKSTK
jgi:hypothetical protein